MTMRNMVNIRLIRYGAEPYLYWIRKELSVHGSMKVMIAGHYHQKTYDEAGIVTYTSHARGKQAGTGSPSAGLE